MLKTGIYLFVCIIFTVNYHSGNTQLAMDLEAIFCAVILHVFPHNVLH